MTEQSKTEQYQKSVPFLIMKQNLIATTNLLLINKLLVDSSGEK